MKDYKKILEGVVNIISTTEESKIVSNICSYINESCPELGIKAQDEIIRKWLVGYFNQYATDGIEEFGNGLEVKDILAWLEKQGEPEPLYIRFGEIPSNERSKIYCGEEEIGEEDGVSVYPAFEVNGNIVLGLTLPITKTTLYTQQHLLEYENRPCYLVKGDYIGKDSDGQPLICNVQIIKKIDNYRVKEEKVDNASGYGIKESGFPYPTKPATFSEHKSDCEHVGCHINGMKRWCHKLQSEVPYEKCSDKCPVYSSKQKPVDKIEPKFHPNDWVVCEDDCSVHQIKGGFENLNNHTYYELTEGGHISNDDVNKWHLWNFENDAKDGDILVSSDDQPFIFNGHFTSQAVCGYCGITLNTFVSGDHMIWNRINKEVKPATREQRNILEKSMAEVGYTFDFDKKELNKITKFKIGDWIVEPREDDPNILWHIDRIIDGFYRDGSVGVSIEEADKYYHVWTLDDANDGDILVSSITNKPFIYNSDYNDDTRVGAYCGLTFGNEFTIARQSDCYWTEKKDVVPATKEQRDFLFERMKEAGYMWDFSNKKPVKI